MVRLSEDVSVTSLDCRFEATGAELNCFCECSIRFSSELSLRFLSTCGDGDQCQQTSEDPGLNIWMVDQSVNVT